MSIRPDATAPIPAACETTNVQLGRARCRGPGQAKMRCVVGASTCTRRGSSVNELKIRICFRAQGSGPRIHSFTLQPT